MTIGEILLEVNLAVDEGNMGLGAHLDTSLSRGHLALTLNSARLALIWLAQNAPLRLLDGSDENEATGMLVSLTDSSVSRSGNVLTMPADYVRLRRLRVDGWHRSVTMPITEDSDEYLMLEDPTATATADRPVVAAVHDTVTKLEMYPGTSGTLSGCYVRHPVTSLQRLQGPTVQSATKVPIPPKLRFSFIYLTAYFVMLALRNQSADKWKAVALEGLGMVMDGGKKG